MRLPPDLVRQYLVEAFGDRQDIAAQGAGVETWDDLMSLVHDIDVAIHRPALGEGVAPKLYGLEKDAPLRLMVDHVIF